MNILNNNNYMSEEDQPILKQRPSSMKQAPSRGDIKMGYLMSFILVVGIGAF